MKIAFGCDHAGFEYKERVIEYLRQKGHEVVDFGTNGPESVDYPVYGEKVGRAVGHGECDLGVLICGTGFGISLSANHCAGVRAVVCSEPFTAQLARRHNNANVLAFGARVVGIEMAYMIIDSFLDAQFEGGRHARRVAMMDAIQREG